MLTFLRKIRNSLIESGSTRKYILYAIGEIALVVIGILIALQINNWNEWRKDRIKEKEILKILEDNLELNILTLNLDIEDLHNHNRSSKIILSVLDNRMPFVDSLASHFHFARVSKTELSLSQAGYEQLKSLGFQIITNDTLRNAVITYFESSYPQWYSVYNQINVQYVPFMDYHVPLFLYTREKLEPIDMNALYDDQYFLGWIRAYQEGRNTLIQLEDKFIEQSQGVLDLIKDEIGESE